MTILTETFTTAPSLRAGFTALRTQVAEAAAKRKVYRQTLTELNGLSDRDLADLGIARTMVRQIAREAAYGL